MVGIGTSINRKTMETAVNTLRSASESDGIVSDDDTFHDRLNDMKKHLDSIVAIKTNEKQ